MLIREQYILVIILVFMTPSSNIFYLCNSNRWN